MKTKLLIIAIVFSLLSCEKENNPSEDYPAIYNLNFELLRNDGSTPEDGEVKISSFPLSMINGDLIGDYEWYGMGKIPAEENQPNDKILFGGPCGVSNCVTDFIAIPFASGAEGRDIGENESWEKDKYWLLQYANEDVDTLRIHDVRTNNPYSRSFSFFINEQQVDAINFIYDEYAVTLQK